MSVIVTQAENHGKIHWAPVPAYARMTFLRGSDEVRRGNDEGEPAVPPTTSYSGNSTSRV